MAKATHFSDFAFQVEMTLIRGDGGGIVFRKVPGVTNGYRFFIGQNYAELFYAQKQLFSSKNVQTLSLENHFSDAGWCAPAIEDEKSDLNQVYLLTVLAKESDIFLYINRQCVAQVQDNSVKSGKIGLMAFSSTQNTHVLFRNAQVWDLIEGAPSPF